ncbi:cdc42 effector protein 5 [Platysternon megacephalum]|uniref:Cdc42 effector protein 5 n=1 Tax=Platysternon megacephalum TaxID=55544 RepID=A0A4D9DL02_9SAUR|nr:cdc42 effector protein 5 [Platysternon megacephalum]
MDSGTQISPIISAPNPPAPDNLPAASDMLIGQTSPHKMLPLSTLKPHMLYSFQGPKKTISSAAFRMTTAALKPACGTPLPRYTVIGTLEQIQTSITKYYA